MVSGYGSRLLVVHYCSGRCRTELNGIKKRVSSFNGQSMYKLGYCYCRTCELYFKPDAQRTERGFVRQCRCCGTWLRHKPTSTRYCNKNKDRDRDVKRIEVDEDIIKQVEREMMDIDHANS